MPNKDEMQLIEGSRTSNWDLYQDAKGWIWYVATPEAEKDGCKSGYWGNAKHYLRMFGKAL